MRYSSPMISVPRQDMPELMGVNILTGESCAYGMRLLCDLNEDGVALVTSWLGIASTGLRGSWNTQVAGKPATASIMLSRHALNDLIKYFLVHVKGCRVIVVRDETSITGIRDYDFYKRLKENGLITDNEVEHYSIPDPERSYEGRNIHSMSQRVT